MPAAAVTDTSATSEATLAGERRSTRVRSVTRLASRWFLELGPEILFLLATTGAGLWAAGRWINPFSNPGFSWSLADRVAQGEKLYREIYLFYSPLCPLLLAAGARVFGASSRYI